MEQSNNGRRSFLPELSSAEELEVSQILLKLPQLIAESFTRRRVGLSWGVTRKRSASDSTPPPVSFSSSPLQFAPGSAALEPTRESESPPLASNKVVALSPATTLAFLPSESDETHKSSRKKSALKKIESEFSNSKLEASPASVVDYPPAIIKDQRSQPNETSSSVCGLGGAKDLNLSHLGIPDLNISLDEAHGGESPQAVAISRAMAAQARQKRIQIYRMKNAAANKQRLSLR